MHYLEYIQKNKTKPLLVFFVILVFPLFPLIKSINYLHKEEILFKEITKNNIFWTSLIICFSLAVTYLIWWYFKYKKIIKFKRDEIGVVFSFNYDEQSESELKKLYDNFTFLIKKQDLQEKIKIYITPKALVTTNENSAYRLRDKILAKLIIWGEITTGTEKSKTKTLLNPIKFSFKSYLNKEDTKKLSQHFSLNIQNNKWVINGDDTLIERGYLVENLHNISIYMIATLLFIEKDYQKSEILLKSLFTTLKNHESNNILLNTKFLLKKLIRIKTLSLNIWPNSKNQKEEIPKAKKIIEEADYYGFKSESLLLKAMVSFLENENKDECFMYLNKAYQLNKSDSGSLFSLAFCYFYIENNKLGWKYFKKALDIEKNNKTTTHEQILNIARWYEECLREKGKEFLEFPLGMIYFKLLNKDGLTLAKDCFEKFITNNKEKKGG